MFIELWNESRSNLKLRKVTVNGGWEPKHVEQVISHTGRLVTTGVEEYPSDFLPIDGEMIRPSLDDDNIKELLSSNDEQNIPIHYGLYLIHDVNIESVEVTYSYFGLPKTKTFQVNIT